MTSSDKAAMEARVEGFFDELRVKHPHASEMGLWVLFMEHADAELKAAFLQELGDAVRASDIDADPDVIVAIFESIGQAEN
jgi:hypothetical protein